MIHGKTLLYIMALSTCLFVGITGGQDWLVGGYVSSIGPYDGDPAISGLKRWLDYPIPTATWYGSNGSVYYVPYGLPYGTYSTYSAAYYPTPGWTPVYGTGWQAYSKEWAKTLEYAQTTSSVRVYPRQTVAYPLAQSETSVSATTQPAITTTQSTSASAQPISPTTSPAITQTATPTTGDSTAIIVSQGMRGYQVYLDGVYIGTEGTGGDPLDGRFSFKVVGNQNHEVRVYDGQFNYPKIMWFDAGGSKTINVEPGTAVYI